MGGKVVTVNVTLAIHITAIHPYWYKDNDTPTVQWCLFTVIFATANGHTGQVTSTR